MYDIYDIVYGFPLTKEILKAASKAEGFPDDEWLDFDPMDLEDLGFELLYSGHGGSTEDIDPGYWGISLQCKPSWEMDIKSLKTLEPTEEQKQNVQTAFDALPQWLKDVAEPIDLYTVWSTS